MMVVATGWLECVSCHHQFQGDNRTCPECGGAGHPVTAREHIPFRLRQLPSDLKNTIDRASFGPIRVLRDIHNARHQQAARTCKKCGKQHDTPEAATNCTCT